MSNYADWNKLDSDEEDEQEDSTLYDGKRDVILFCIDCSSSMHVPYDDPLYEGMQSCHLLAALDAVVQIQKKKIIVGPNDSVGVLMFNTTRKPDADAPKTSSEIKENVYLYQPITLLGAPEIQSTIHLIDLAREQGLSALMAEFPPVEDKRRVSMGDVFTTVNWVFRDGAPKTAIKRVFLITDEDDPHAAVLATAQDKSIRRKKQKVLAKSAKTTLVDLSATGITVEPFFISTESKPFNLQNFYASILPDNIYDPEDNDDDEDTNLLPSSISISKIDDLLAQMKFREVPKRAFFTLPFSLGSNLDEEGESKEWVIGVKGYSSVTEQKKGTYRYFVDLGDRLEPTGVRTSYLDELVQSEIPRQRILYGTTTGSQAADDDDPGGASDGEDELGFNGRRVPYGTRPFYTAAEVQEFRNMGLESGIKLLGFKDKEELLFEDNIKHSVFLYPDDSKYSGSKRTFTAMLRTMLNKGKIAYARALLRKNWSVIFCALLPQEENEDTGDPAGFHLIPLPFADDIRSATVTDGKRASEELVESARQWIRKLTIKNGGYPPDSYPNPALAYHNVQLEAFAFREEFDPDRFEDLTEPKYDGLHKRAGIQMQNWKGIWRAQTRDDTPPPPTKAAAGGNKRKAADAAASAGIGSDDAEVRSRHESGTLSKLTVVQLKDFLKSKGEPVSGTKGVLLDRVTVWLDTHSV